MRMQRRAGGTQALCLGIPAARSGFRWAAGSNWGHAFRIVTGIEIRENLGFSRCKTPTQNRFVISHARTHDLTLPDWGPYTKHYMGVSHISDVASGYRFDLSLVPGFHRKKSFLRHVLRKPTYHPWEAALMPCCHRRCTCRREANG